MTSDELYLELSPHRYHDMPVIMATSDDDPDFGTTYWPNVSVRVERMLVPADVEEEYGDVLFHGWTLDTMGLRDDKYYTDEFEAADDICDYLSDSDCGADIDRGNGAWQRVYGPIAEMICAELPWKEVLVIDAG